MANEPTLRDLLKMATEAGAETTSLPLDVEDPDLQILVTFMAAQNILLGVIASSVVETAELVTEITDMMAQIFVEVIDDDGAA